MNRRQTLQKAWLDRSYREVIIDPNTINPSYERGFANGFNDAWGALMNEIRPLVADLRSYQELKRRGEASDIFDHKLAVNRLRALVQKVVDK